MANITLGSRYVIDETAALQNFVLGTNSPSAGDADFNVSTLPAAFKSRLDAIDASYLAFATANGIARSAAGVIQVTGPGPIESLVLADSANGTLNGDPAISTGGSPILTLAGNRVFLYVDPVNPLVVFGREGNGASPPADPSTANVVFAIYLEASGLNTTTVNAKLCTVLYEPIQHPTGDPDEVVDLGNSIQVGAPGDLVVNLGTLASGQTLFGSFGDPKDADADAEVAVIVIAREGSDGDTVNTSQGGGKITIGIGNQHIDPGDGAWFTFATGMTGTTTNQGVKLPSAGANEANGEDKIVYDGFYGSSGASFKIVQIQGGGNDPKTNVTISAWLEDASAPQGAAFVNELGDDTQVKILESSVKVTLDGVDITASVGIDQAGDGKSIILTGVPDDATVRYLTVAADGVTSANHNRLLIENVDGNGFDIGGFGLVGPPAFTAIGQLIGFGDDGPTASIALTGNEAVTDESTGANASDTGLAAPNDEGALTPSLVPAAARLIGFDQANVVTTAGTGVGTDGGTSSVTLELGANTDSGLTTTDGTAITLVKEGTIVVGRAAGEAIFAIGINASGQVTVEQYDSIRHTPVGTFDDVARIATGRLFAKVAAADGDTDAASQQIDIGQKIGMEDDGPGGSLALNAVFLITDESVGSDPADTNAFDENGQGAGVIGYATLSGDALFTKSSDFGEDEEGATALFSLRINNVNTALKDSVSGQTVTLAFALGSTTTVIGSAAGSEVLRIAIDATSGAVTMTQYRAVQHTNVTNTDEELSTALGSNVLYAVYTVTDGDSDKVNPEVDLGAITKIEDDGPKLTDNTFNDLTIGNTPNTTVSDNAVSADVGTDANAVWSITDAPGAVGTGATGFRWNYSDSTGDGIADTNKVVGKLDGVSLYSLFVDADGTYDFTLLSALTGTDKFLDTSDIKAGGPDTNFIDVGTLDTTGDYVKISGYFDADGPGGNPRGPAAVNESNANVGVVNGNLDANETLSFSLYDAGGVIQDISGISIGTKTPKTTNYLYTAFNDGVAVTGMTDVAIAVSKNGKIEINASAGVLFDTVEVTSVNGNAVKIGLGDISIKILPPDYLLGFTLNLADADADPTQVSFTVGIDGDGNGTIDAPVTAFAAPSGGESAMMAHELSGLDAAFALDQSAPLI